MKILNHIKGNLLDMADAGDFDIIVQGCNCHNVMGSGIAKDLRARYPQAWEADCNDHLRHEHVIEKLGNYSYAMAEDFMIVNAYTQVTTNRGPDFKDLFEYESFGVILRKLAAKHGTRRFGFPYIGMGLAGGDKARIIAMLDVFANEVTATGGSVTLVEFVP